MAKINEKVLWEAAEKLRDKCNPTEYKDIVLGLVFLKYVSDKFTNKYNELKSRNDGSEHNEEKYISEHIFIVENEAKWDYISSFCNDESIGQKIEEAFVLLEKKNDELKNILPKIYSNSDLDKVVLGELVNFFTNSLKMDDTDGDFFGQIYEYYISAFAKYIPTKGGEFFTPKTIVELMVEILEPYKGRVYDPCCGSGGMFVQCSKFVKNHQGNIDNISIYGQESNPGNWKMAKMNLAIRGIEGNLGEKSDDSFTSDLHKNLKVDFIIANPPYNLKKYWKPILEGDDRWVFGKPNTQNANFAWLELIYSKLNNNGYAAVLMPNGATTSNTKEDYEVRKTMIEQGKVMAIIDLPDKMFSNTGISVQCWVLSKSKTNKDVLFLSASKLGKMIDRKTRILEDHEIKLISSIYHNYKNNEGYEDKLGFCKKASLEEIKEKDYSLNPGRYIGVDESNKKSLEELKQDLIESSNELFKLMDDASELENKVKEILKKEML